VIVVSLLLIVVSGGLLAAGVSSAADSLVITSIGLSLLAAGSLFLGIRQQRDALEQAVAGGRNPGPLPKPAVGAATVARPVSAAEDEPTVSSGVRLAGADVTEVLAAAGTRVPGQTRRSGSRAGVATEDPPGLAETGFAADGFVDTNFAGTGFAADGFAGDDEDPADEPSPEPVLATEVARLSQLGDEVFVVDGRPRYHLASCPHLAGRESQPLPVGEAVELGFTGCGRCAAATTLLGR
jgi:hypothetical protein